MILMPQIFDVTANENARYKRNELELLVLIQSLHVNVATSVDRALDHHIRLFISAIPTLVSYNLTSEDS